MTNQDNFIYLYRYSCIPFPSFSPLPVVDNGEAKWGQMLERRKSKLGAKTQSEVDVYERQIKSVDEAIDRLVYELYGLNEEKVRIVEGKE